MNGLEIYGGIGVAGTGTKGIFRKDDFLGINVGDMVCGWGIWEGGELRCAGMSLIFY